MILSSMPAAKAQVLPFETFQQPLSPLFLDYLAGRPAVGPFLGDGRLDLEAIVAAAARAAAHPRPREAVAEALARQQEERGSSRAALAARSLAKPETVAVVTGQQAGIFGGPLFVLYKALTTLELARRLAEARGEPVVPVFWVASEDHDFAEVRSVCVLDGEGGLCNLRYTPAEEPSGQPAWAITLDDDVSRLVAELRERLPQSPARDDVVAMVDESYRPGETLSGSFARLLSRLFPDLVVLDPVDPALKAVTAPVLAREIEESSPTSRLALEAGQALLEAGYHQQVPVRPGFLNLFLLAEGERRALAFGDEGIEVRGLGRMLAKAEALRALREDPLPWSPNALLRPITQDSMLPTAAYVGGPAEIAYHAQIGGSYAHFGVPRPVLVPRPSVTLVEPAQSRALEAEGLSLADLAGDPEAVLGRWVKQAHPEVDEAFERVRESIERDMAAVEETLGALDPTLAGAATSAKGRALHQIEGLREKSTRALKKRDEGRAARMRRTRDALFPGGAFQERGLGLIGAVARHGTPFLDELRNAVDPFAHGHQVIRL